MGEQHQVVGKIGYIVIVLLVLAVAEDQALGPKHESRSKLRTLCVV